MSQTTYRCLDHGDACDSPALRPWADVKARVDAAINLRDVAPFASAGDEELPEPEGVCPATTVDEDRRHHWVTGDDGAVCGDCHLLYADYLNAPPPLYSLPARHWH